MNGRIDDGDLAPRLRELAASYHRPPNTPSEEIWARIASELAAPQVPDSPRWRAWGWNAAAAAAALVAIGFGLGRITRHAPSPVVTAAVGTTESDGAYRVAAAEHLTESEALLTVVRVDADAGHLDASITERTRSLLARTRLLLDSPAGQDPAVKPVLEDLELMLAQISLLGSDAVAGERRGEELRLIAEGMDTQDMVPRIQAVLPVLKGS